MFVSLAFLAGLLAGVFAPEGVRNRIRSLVSKVTG